MQRNELYEKDDSIFRVLEIRDDKALLIDCLKRTVPFWVNPSYLSDAILCPESALHSRSGISPADMDSLSPDVQRFVRERYTMICGLLPIVGDDEQRRTMIRATAEYYRCSPQTVRNALFKYLAFQSVTVFAPQPRKEAPLSKDEKTYSPFQRIIPSIVVQCPFDSSVKGLLLEILRRVDETLDTAFYKNAVRMHATTDMLIGSVSQICLNHIGLLVVDEIQNVCNHKNGMSLIASLTQLINNSGISICMVGTPESANFFENAMQLARRSLGLQYSALPLDGYFRILCETLYGYQYVRSHSELDEATIQWLYEHSGGITLVVVSLIHDAQELAILDGTEELGIASLKKAYAKRMQMMHRYISPEASRKTAPAKPRKKAVVVTAETSANILPQINPELENAHLIADLFAEANEKSADFLACLRSKVTVREV